MVDMSSVVRAVVLTAVLLKILEDISLLEYYSALFCEQYGTTALHNTLP